MKIKDGVDVRELRPGIRSAFVQVDRIHKELANQEATITSGTEGRHSVKRSAHYRGDAVDLRVWHVDGQEYADKLAEALGDDYVVLFEGDHVHLHWSPVYAG